MFRISLSLMVSCLLVAPAAPVMAQGDDDTLLRLAQERHADKPRLDESGGESDHEYDPEERPGGYGESEPVTDYDIQVEDMDKKPSTPPDPEERKDEPKGDVEPHQREEAEEKPWYRFWE